MRALDPILVAPLFQPLNDELVALLRGLSAEEWTAPTVCAGWSVKDIAAHLLDTALRRLSSHRDHHQRTEEVNGGLVQIVNFLNREWVSTARRLSPEVLTDMLDRYGRQMAEYFATIDPYGPAQWAVSWAGEEKSPMWFDVARELTERWHHQQQIRDAVGRPPLYESRFFVPVIDTFMRALPFTYRAVDAPAGTSLAFEIADVGNWFLHRGSAWTLSREGNGTPAATVSMSGDTAWRLFTKGLSREVARTRVEITGERQYGEQVFSTLAIIG
jgi:uncharacterized protein (TIGR03083 family)